MATIADLNVRLGADSKQMISELNKAAREFRKKSREMAELADNMFTAVTLPVIGLGAAAISSTADIERLTNAMTSTMGSAEAAAKEIELLRQAAAAPGLDFEQALKGSVRLQAVGISAEDSRRALSAFGNALALAGGSASDLDGIALALGQIAAKGKVSAEEINQLAERTPQIRAAMKDAFGTADTEQLQKMGITAEKFISEIITSFEKLPKATGGLTESMTNFQTSIKLAFATLGNSISTATNFEGALNTLADAVAGLANWFSELSPWVQKLTVYVTLGLAAIGPYAKAIAALSGLKALYKDNLILLIKQKAAFTFALTRARAAFIALDTAMKVTVIGAIAAAVAALGYALYQVTRETTNAEKATAALADVQTRAKQAIVDEEMKVEDLIKTLNDETASRNDKLAAIKALQEIAPQVKVNLTKENELQQNATELKKQYVAALIEQAEAEILVTEIAQKRRELAGITAKSDQVQLSIFQGLKKTMMGFAGPAAAMAYEQQLIAENSKEVKSALEAEIKALEKRAETLVKPNKQISIGGGVATGGGGEDPEKKRVKGVADVLGELEKKYGDVATRAQLFGNVTSVNADRAELLRDSITELLDMGLDPSNEQVQNLIGRYQTLTQTLDPLASSFSTINSMMAESLTTTVANKEEMGGFADNVQRFFQNLKLGIEDSIPTVEDFVEAWKTLKGFAEDFGETMEAAAYAAQDAVFNMVHEGKANLKDFAKEASKAAAKVIRTYIMQGVAAVVKDALEKFGVLGIAIGAAAGAGAGVLFNTVLGKLKIPAFAQGGLVYGPQLAMVGDNPGAATDPEVIAPLSKLQGMMGRSQEITGVVRVAGSDLLIMLENAQRNQKRYGT